MPSPLSDEGTLDKTVTYCQDHNLNTTPGKHYGVSSYHYKDNVVFCGRFIFDAHKHDTGCGVRVWVVADDKDIYNIINTTYWYYSRYTSNDSKWERGTWDMDLNKAIAELEHMVEIHKAAVLQRTEHAKQQQDSEEAERKAKFEALFAG